MPGETDRSLRWSLVNGGLNAVMLGCGEAYLGPFAVFLSAPDPVIGALATLPLFLGAGAQLVAVRLLDRGPSRRRMAVGLAATQAVTWAAIFGAPLLLPDHAPWLLLAAAMLYFVAGHGLVPVWNSWMGDLVPSGSRGAYFGRHARISSLGAVAALVGAALVLHAGRAHGREWAAFGAIFGVALAARLASAGAFLRMHDAPTAAPTDEERFTFWDFIRRTGQSNFAKFTFFVALLQGTAFIAGPYFAPFMLRDLGFSYLQFLGSAVVFNLAQILTMHRWGRLCDRIGARRIMRVTAVLIPLVPMPWLISTRWEWIIAAQAFSGVVWGGFNLAAMNFLFDAVSPPKRARCVAYYHLLLNGAMLAGAMAGGALVSRLGEPIFAYPLQTVFLISAVARALPVLLLLPLVREVRRVETAPTWSVWFTVIGLRPLRGLGLGVISSVDEPPPKPPPSLP